MTGLSIYISTVHLMPIVIEQNHGIKGVAAKIVAVIVAIGILVFLEMFQ